MTRDIIEINDFVVLLEHSVSEKNIVDSCGFDEDVIGFSFYGSGNVTLDIHYGSNIKTYQNTKGIALSFFANEEVNFVHQVNHEKPLQCICVFSSIQNLKNLPEQEGDLYIQYLYELVNPKDIFVEGPVFYMNHQMMYAVDKIFNTQFTGATRKMFIRSQVTELLSHFFELLAKTTNKEESISEHERKKLYHAQEIITNNMDTPPSLSELSKIIGLNDYKLKKNFKELFGVPVYKYLQNERLNKAHDLLRNTDISIQEAAWHVGYESISSFSSSFLKKFGFRPSEIKR